LDPRVIEDSIPGETADLQPLSRGLYARVARVVSYLFIASALIVVTVAGVPDLQPLLYVVLATGALLIVLSQDVLPMDVLGRWRGVIEAGMVLAFLTVLIMLTGGYTSPFFVGYLLLLAGTSLWAQGAGPYVLALAAFASYLFAVLLAPGGLPIEGWGTVGFNIVALALTSYVASIIGREQRRAHESALRLSRFDGLTQLHSRSFIGLALEQEILRSARTGRPFGLLMFDLDGLKPVNDRFGHASGDRLLRGVADVVRGGIRVTDVAGRYGGDEFIVILPETDAAGGLRVAEKLRRDIAQLSLPENGQMIRSTVSIGLVTHPDDGRTAVELLRRADAAMYEAKRRGRDQIVRYHSLGAKQAVPMGGPASPAREVPPPGAAWDRSQALPMGRAAQRAVAARTARAQAGMGGQPAMGVPPTPGGPLVRGGQATNGPPPPPAGGSSRPTPTEQSPGDRPPSLS
jgi:diguanylate cyclase (GGDEF)-like protein